MCGGFEDKRTVLITYMLLIAEVDVRTAIAYGTEMSRERYVDFLTNEASTCSCRERSGKRSASKEYDAIARHIGNEGGIPFLQAARSEQDVYLPWRI
jgi:hypothetical protein